MAKKEPIGASKGEGAIVRICSCVHEFQDGRYGKKRRLCNMTTKKQSRCTVCGTVA